MTNEEFDKRFTYHLPKGDQTGRYKDIRAMAKDFALAIDNMCPDSREKSISLTKIEEASFWANAAIARNE